MKPYLEQKLWDTTFNCNNPFNFFPDWKNYPHTGTHVGVDHKVSIGTPILAPTHGEMFKAIPTELKGNVGIFIVNVEGIAWAFEFAHLRELPTLGPFKQGDIIAHSGKTGTNIQGAHLHTVLHKWATVTSNYAKLISRDAAVKMINEGRLQDPTQWINSRHDDLTT